MKKGISPQYIVNNRKMDEILFIIIILRRVPPNYKNNHYLEVPTRVHGHCGTHDSVDARANVAPCFYCKMVPILCKI